MSSSFKERAVKLVRANRLKLKPERQQRRQQGSRQHLSSVMRTQTSSSKEKQWDFWHQMTCLLQEDINTDMVYNVGNREVTSQSFMVPIQCSRKGKTRWALNISPYRSERWDNLTWKVLKMSLCAVYCSLYKERRLQSAGETLKSKSCGWCIAKATGQQASLICDWYQKKLSSVRDNIFIICSNIFLSHAASVLKLWNIRLLTSERASA